MHDTILLPTDGSDNAELAAERAIDLADRFDATLHVLYVVEKTRDDPDSTWQDRSIQLALV
jgi:nucleotide-binding universal stress UspA family protein